VDQYVRVTEVDMQPIRRTSAALRIQANATEHAAWRTVHWAAVTAVAVTVWIVIRGPILVFAVGVVALGAVDSAGAWYRMRRYVFEKYRANPSTHIR
jgi:hypothetical protein